MTNPPSEVKCCEKCVGTLVNHSIEDIENVCENPSCPCHKESPVSQSRLKEALESVDKQVGGALRALGSQSVEGWEKEFDEKFDKMTPSWEGSDESVAPLLNREQADIKLFVKSFISTTLSTLVKEMEKEKKISKHDIYDGYPDMGRFSCRKCGLAFPNATPPDDCELLPDFNAGISAAVEVVKKMV